MAPRAQPVPPLTISRFQTERLKDNFQKWVQSRLSPTNRDEHVLRFFLLNSCGNQADVIRGSKESPENGHFYNRSDYLSK